MAESTFNFFKAVVLMMLFYSFSMTIITYSLPSDSLNYVNSFGDSIDQSSLDYSSITEEVQGGLDAQSNVPLVEVGALVFYSGNILVDLILNFLTAIPQMLALLINGLQTLFGNSLDVGILAIIEGFTTAAVTIYYIIGLINLTTNIRSGRVL